MFGWQNDRRGIVRIPLHACISRTINKQIVNSMGIFKLTLLHGGIPYIPAISAA